MDVTIIGGGVIGLNSAYYLHKAGHTVTVIDSGDITDNCSFGNMGYVSPSHFIPLATPGIVKQGMKWMLNSSSPFYIKPRLSMDLIRWGWQFFQSANADTVRRNIPHLDNLLQLSRRLINDMADDIGNTFSLTQNGCWMLYRHEKTGEHEKHLADDAAKLGLKTIQCTAAEVQAYEKEVEVTVAGGVLYLDDCYVDPGALMRSLYQWLEKEGVRFRLKTTVTGFEKTGGRVTAVLTGKEKITTEEVIVANGSWIPGTMKQLGIRLLLQPGKGYSVNYTGLQQNLLYPSILVDDRVATTPYDRRLRIGGTMEMSGHSNNVLPKRVAAIYHAVKKYYPTLAIDPPDTQKAWYGYRPVTPDGMPYIGRHTTISNLCIAGGHAMLGVSAANATGKLITELIGREPTTISLDAFDPGRFS